MNNELIPCISFTWESKSSHFIYPSKLEEVLFKASYSPAPLLLLIYTSYSSLHTLSPPTSSTSTSHFPPLPPLQQSVLLHLIFFLLLILLLSPLPYPPPPPLLSYLRQQKRLLMPGLRSPISVRFLDCWWLAARCLLHAKNLYIRLLPFLSPSSVHLSFCAICVAWSLDDFT